MTAEMDKDACGKNILVLISRFLDGGIDTVLVEYLNNLSLMTDCRVTLAIMMPMGDLEVYIPRISPSVEIRYLLKDSVLTAYKARVQHGKKNAIFGFFDEVLLNPVRRFLVQSKLKAMSEEFDVMVDFDSCFSSFVHPEWNIRKIAFFHFSFSKELERKPRRIKRLRSKFGRYDYVVTISEAMLQEAKILFPEYAKKFVKIYNSVNVGNLEQKAACEIDTGAPYILAIERLEESQKDITTLLKAYQMLIGENKSVPDLVIIGKGKDENKLKEMAVSFGVSDKVRFLGFLPNPYPWIKNALLIVHSSKYEGLPTVLIESLLLGKFIVSSDCPTGPAEILDHGKAGMLVPVGDAKAFADAVRRMLEDKELQLRISEQVCMHKCVFLPETNIKQFERLLQ